MHNNNYKDNFTIKRNNCKQTGKFLENVQIANTPSHQSDFWQLTRVQGKHKRNAKANQCPQSIAKWIRTYLVNNWCEVKRNLFQENSLLVWVGRWSFFANAISNIFQGLQVSSVVLSRYVLFSFFLFFSFLCYRELVSFFIESLFSAWVGLGFVSFSLFFVFFSLKHFPGVVLVGLYHQTEQ